MVQYSTVQYSTVQYSTVQYSTVQYSTVQYSSEHDFTAGHAQLTMVLFKPSSVLYKSASFSVKCFKQDIVVTKIQV